MVLTFELRTDYDIPFCSNGLFLQKLLEVNLGPKRERLRFVHCLWMLQAACDAI